MKVAYTVHVSTTSKRFYFTIFAILFLSLSFPKEIKSQNDNAKINIETSNGINVNTWNGNLYYSIPIFTIPGNNLPVQFELNNNSHWKEHDSPYGSGWNSTYHIFYSRETNGDILISRGNGRTDRFLFDINDGSYSAPKAVYDSLTEYLPGKFRLRTKNGMKYYFDSTVEKMISRIEDANGNTIHFNYDGDGLLTSIEGTSGLIASFSYSNGKLASVTDQSGRTFLFQHDGNGNLTTLTNPHNHSINYNYDGNFLVGVTNVLGNTTTINYANDAVSSVNNSMASWGFSFDTLTHVTQVNHSSQITNYVYDEEGRINTIIDPLGFESLTIWDEFDNMTSVINENGHSTFYEYDFLGNVTKITNPLGHETVYTYEANFSRVTSITNANGLTTTYDYDINSNLTQVNYPLSISLQYEYDVYGNVISTTDGRGFETTYIYNEHGNLVTVNHPIGSKSYTYDLIGNVLSITDANGNTNTNTYDSMNRLISNQDPLGNTIQYTYDAIGNRTSITDLKGNTTTFNFDELNRLTAASTPIGTTIGYAYDAQNNLISLTNLNGYSTLFSYDDKNRLASEIDPLGHITTYAYDAFGNVTSQTDANGNLTTYEYDALNRLITKSYVGNSESFTYDVLDNILATSNDNISITYIYDALSRLINKTVLTWNKSINYGYDENSNRISMTDPDSGETTYIYDGNNRLISLENPSELITAFSYDNAGRVTQQNNANGTYTTYSYDTANRLLDLTNYKSGGEVISSFTYTHDPNGNRLTMTDKDGGLNTYQYNFIDEVIGVTYSNGDTETFQFDGQGNRRQIIKNGVSELYTQNELDQYLTRGNVSYEFDLNGNMVKKIENLDETIYEYDGKNRLIQITFPDGTTNEFYYEPSSDMRVKMVNSAGTETNFLNDGGNTLLESDISGNTITRFTSGLGLDTWLMMESNGDDYTYQKDGLGSIITLTNSNETSVNEYQFDIYGNILEETSSVNNPYLFTGRRFDSDSDLYFYRARFYDSSIGRFVTIDPIGFQAGYNKYRYVFNNPVNLVDPSGLSAAALAKFAQFFYSFFEDDVDSGEFEEGENPIPPLPPPPLPTPTPPPPPPPSGGGDEGGVESNRIDILPSHFLTGNDLSEKKLNEGAFNTLLNLSDILPLVGLNNTNLVVVTPQDVQIGIANVTETLGHDFIDQNTGLNRAAILGITTSEVAYNHEYAVCNRFHDYILHSAVAVPLSDLIPGMTEPAWFWYASTTKDSLVEETFVFNVFVNESEQKFTIDSKWLSDLYSPSSPDFEYDYVFNLQVWASNANDALILLERVFENLQNISGWTIEFENMIEPSQPTVLTKAVQVVGSNVLLSVQSWSNMTETVTFFGTYRSATDWTTDIDFNFDKTIEPGFNIVELPLGDLIDAVIRYEVNGFSDKLYVGGGFWFAFDDMGAGLNSSIDLTLPNCTPSTTYSLDDVILPGCAIMSGSVVENGFIGIGRTLNPNGLPVDMSSYNTLIFNARGDGKTYRLLLETKSVSDLGSNDFHQIIFTTSEEWRQYVIPISTLKQQFNNDIPFTGEDVKALIFTTIWGPHDSINFQVERVAFTNSTLIEETTILSNTTDTLNTYSVSSIITDNSEIEIATLFYSTNGGMTYEEMPMTDNANLFTAEIPNQSWDIEIRYYIEATDIEGNVATNPVDVPYSPYRFQVSDNPYLLVDDFNNTDPKNVLGGESSLFELNGGTLEAFYDKQSVQLVYNVPSEESIVSYITETNEGIDVSSFTAISVLLKGEETEIARISIKDGNGYENQIVVTEYMDGGITEDWKKVTIPLAAFGNSTDFTNIMNVTVTVGQYIYNESGVLYIDEIKFEQLPNTPIVIDNFNALVNTNGVGGSIGDATGGTGSITGAFSFGEHYGDYGFGYSINVNGITTNDWAVSFWDLKGIDASLSDTLSLIIKGEVNPNVYLVSSENGNEQKTWVDIENYVALTNEWQVVNIPLEDFIGINLSNLTQFQLAFEWDEMEGEVIVENIILNGQIDISTSVKPTSLISNQVVKIYPNPANEYLKIDVMLSKPENGDIVIYDVLGRAVYTKAIQVNSNKESFEIPVINFPSGTYTVKIAFSNKGYTENLVIKR